MGRHYLDHASTSPCRPEAVAAMVPWLGVAADPARVHTEGLTVRQVVEHAREQVAQLLGARSREVVFTSGATEAINAAVWGAAERGPVIACSAVEHSAVREAAARHQEVVIAVDSVGRVDLDALDKVLGGEALPALVNVQWANHEVGTIQPVAEVVERCRERGVLVHVDAAMAAGHLPVDFGTLGADLLSVSAHKMGGPAGAGALLVRRGLRLRPFVVGGDQERARRAGLENVPAIVGFGVTADVLAGGVLEKEAAEHRRLTERVLEAATAIDGMGAFGDTQHRVPHLVCLGVEGVEAEPVLLGLDQRGIAVHSGSACSSEALEPSPVLEAMGAPADRSLRVSVGWSTTDADVDAFVDALPEVVANLRALNPLRGMRQGIAPGHSSEGV
jgi:cysteine desulfurase